MNLLNSVQIWLVRLLVFSFPLFFLPITSEFFDINKVVLLGIGTLGAIILWALSRMQGEFKFRVTPFDLPVLAFAVVYVASALIVTPNKMDAFFAPGMASFVLFATLFYFLVVQQSGGREGDEGENLATVVIGGGAIAGLVAALAGTGILASVVKAETLPVWLTQPTFNTIGGSLPALTVFVVLGVLTIGRIMGGQSRHMVLNTVFLILLVAGAATSVYHMLPGKPASPRLLPVATGWSIALETLKQEPLLGVGPGNFVAAFNRFRSVDYNNTSVWNLRFSASSNWYLETWTVAGLLGIVAFLWLAWTVVRENAKLQMPNTKWIYYALVTALVVMLLVPVGLVLLVTFYLLLALVAAHRASDLRLEFSASGGASRNNLVPGFFGLLALVGLVALGFWGRPVYAAELAYKNALDAVGRNDGLGAYNSLILAINQNTQVDRYRITYSQINLALANNIAAKQDLTDEERTTVSQLIQQAIREGQAAVALNRGRSGNWENLARIYQAIMPFAKDADQFAIQTYQQAVSLDPVNPNLRIALGGVYYGLGNYEEAVKVFEVAALAKPDLANAHYNLAVALRDKKDTRRAAAEMAQVVNLVPAGSADYDKAKKELDELQAKLKEEEATPSAQVAPGQGQQPPLQAPQPAPEQVIEPPIELPQEAAPPEAEQVKQTP